jgi:sulfur carrier protein ThiS
MRITFKTASTMVKYLPAGSRNLMAEIDVATGATPLDVMAQLGIPTDGIYLVTHNGVSVPTAQRPGLTLATDDTLAIMPPLKGG